MNAQQFWNIENVSSFRNFDVVNGEISLTENEYKEFLNDIYGSVTVCGQEFDQGDLLEDADLVAFRCGKSDYESEIQSELEEQLSREDSDNIEFIDGDEDDLTEENECACCYGTNEELNDDGICGTCVEWNEEESDKE